MSIDSPRPDFEFYKKRAKALVKLHRRRDAEGIERIRTYHPRFRNATHEAICESTFRLADAQLVVARENRMISWSELKERVEFVRRTLPELLAHWSDALNDRDQSKIETLLTQHPPLKHQEFYPREKLPGYHAATYGPLLWAVWIEEFDIVQLLLNHGADPNHASQSCLPLLLATEEMSDLLISKGADVNRYCMNGGTPLMWGICDLNRVRYLIGKGADVNLAKPNSGETPLMLLMGCENEHEGVEIASLLVRHGVQVNARSRTGLDDQPILNHGNDQNISQGGMTALHLAAELGKARLTDFLLRNGANRHLKTASSRTVFFGAEDKPFPFEPFPGETAIDWAVRSGHEQVIRRLAPTLLDDLYWASAAGAQTQVKQLLRNGADVNKANAISGKLPLDIAVEHKRRPICHILLSHKARSTCDIDQIIELGMPEMMQRALQSDASLKSRLLASPRKLLESIRRGGKAHREMIELVARSGPHVEEELFLAVGLQDLSYFRRVQSEFPNALASALDAVPEFACFCVWEPVILQAVLNAGADVEERDQLHSATPLHWAIKLNQAASVQLLLKHGADANSVLPIGDARATPLLLIVQQRSECNMKLVELLLDHGADPNWQMHNGYTAHDILNQRWGNCPESEYENATKILRRFGGKPSSEL